MIRERLIEDLRALLGLGPDDELLEIDYQPAPESAVGRGEAAASVRPFDETMIRAAFDSGDFVDVLLGPLAGTPICLKRWGRVPGLFFLENALEGVVVGGDYRLEAPGTYVIDSRFRPFAFRTTIGGDDCAVWVHRAEAGVVRPGLSRAMKGIEQWEPPPTLHVSVPAPSVLVEGFSCPEWLLSLAGELADSPAVLDRLASAGVLARLWSPTRRVEAAGLVRASILGNPSTVSSRVVEWARTMPEATRAEAELIAIVAVDALSERLEDLHAAVASEAAHRLALGRSILHDRDDLESIALVLRLAGGCPHLRNALDAFDREGKASVFTFSMIAGLGNDDRLRAVASQDPPAWWGTLATW